MASRTRWLSGIALLALLTVGLAVFVRSAKVRSAAEAGADRGAPSRAFDPHTELESVLRVDSGSAAERQAVGGESAGWQGIHDTATLVVEVVRWGDVAPVSGVHVHVLGSECMTDAGGTAVVEVRSGTRLLVTAWTDDRSLELGMGQASVAELVPGERRTVRVELPENRQLAFFGRVVDEVDGRPVADARITSDQLETPLASDALRSWTGEIEDGTCTFACLPARVPLSVALLRRGASLPIGETLVLEPGEERRVEW